MIALEILEEKKKELDDRATDYSNRIDPINLAWAIELIKKHKDEYRIFERTHFCRINK